MSSAAQYVVAFGIIFVLLALFAVVLRRVTGNRIVLPGQDRGRTRQPRLGVVDIYDLDRQRQLVLVRRDNIEHLVMIGGPNDVVVETNIIKSQGIPLGRTSGSISSENDFQAPVVPALPTQNTTMTSGAMAPEHSSFEEDSPALRAPETVTPSRLPDNRATEKHIDEAQSIERMTPAAPLLNTSVTMREKASITDRAPHRIEQTSETQPQRIPPQLPQRLQTETLPLPTNKIAISPRMNETSRVEQQSVNFKDMSTQYQNSPAPIPSIQTQSPVTSNAIENSDEPVLEDMAKQLENLLKASPVGSDTGLETRLRDTQVVQPHKLSSPAMPQPALKTTPVASSIPTQPTAPAFPAAKASPEMPKSQPQLETIASKISSMQTIPVSHVPTTRPDEPISATEPELPKADIATKHVTGEAVLPESAKASRVENVSHESNKAQMSPLSEADALDMLSIEAIEAEFARLLGRSNDQ